MGFDTVSAPQLNIARRSPGLMLRQLSTLGANKGQFALLAVETVPTGTSGFPLHKHTRQTDAR
jgi:hypothetical protein